MTAGASAILSLSGAHVRIRHDCATVGDIVGLQRTHGWRRYILPRSKSHSTLGVALGHDERTLVCQWIRNMRWGWRETGGTVVRKAGDGNNRQASAGGHAGRGAAGPASPAENTPSYAGGVGAPQRH
jgi:hypothetical protein